MTRRAAAAALALLVAAGGCGGDGEPEAGVAARAADSVVAVAATGCRLQPTRAVGTVVADGLVLTVAHAVAGEDEIVVSTGDGRDLAADVVAIDTERDAAILRVEHLGLDPLARRAAERGEPVQLLVIDDGRVLAEPAEVRRRVMLRTSDIYRDGEHLRPGLEVAGEVEAGDSGGGVVGQDGRLVGIVWARSREVDDRAWATRIEVADPLLAAVAEGTPPQPATCSR
jgi:S1-C subfamily serine protease